MNYCVEVATKPGFRDSRAEDLKGQIELLGVPGVDSVDIADRYFLSGTVSPEDVTRIAEELLHDPVVEIVRVTAGDIASVGESEPSGDGRVFTVDVVLHPGVTDTPAESLLAGLAEIGVSGVDQAATGTRYTLRGSLDDAGVQRIAASLLANPVIQTWHINEPAPPPFTTKVSADAGLAETIPISGLDDGDLAALSNERRLSLDTTEMIAIRTYFESVEREPTDLELETLAQTWSEHCVHKTFRALITYTGPPPGADGPSSTYRVDSILKSHIKAATDKAAKPWIRSAFVDDAGIVALDDTTDLAFKVETHNHPSALEPFGGANTGVGGVVRDVIGVSARPIANTNVLCFGPQETGFEELPDGVLHPKRIAAGVVAGIEDYGNKMGIPTVNGAVLYDPGYTANPLVFCGCLGVLPTGSHPTEPEIGDRVVVLGGRTGRDGLRGATFSSMESDHTTSDVSGSAVQIGHPIHEKQTLEAIMIARDEGLYNAITDCGAGGLSSSVGEMAEDLGAVVHLDRVPLKYPGLAPWEIWLSEAQERMVIAVPEGNLPRVSQICADLDVEMTVLGEFTGDGVLRVLNKGKPVAEIDCDFLHNGLPRLELEAEWHPAPAVNEPMPLPTDNTEALLALLGDRNIASKEDIVRRYDHEVQGGTVVKPFVGTRHQGPGDAAVVTPIDVQRNDGPIPGAALGIGVNPAYGELDPYRMAWAVIDEAVRNVVAVGADPDRVSILDNFSWGNPRIADRLGSLVRCTQGCYDAAVAYGTPFISGKDSLNNEYTGIDGRKHTIPGTLVISALGIVPDVSKTATSDLKDVGNIIYVVGSTGNHLGGSALAGHAGSKAGSAPEPVTTALDGYRSLHEAIQAGLVQSCHDISEGGLAVAIAEMAIGGDLGASISLEQLPRQGDVTTSGQALFSESLGRLVVEVTAEDSAAFEQTMGAYPVSAVGTVVAERVVEITGLEGEEAVSLRTDDAERQWRRYVESET